MFIKNYTNSNLTFNAKGTSVVLTANATTLVPDGLTTIEELQKLFGPEAVAIDTTGPSTSIMTNQQILTTGKLYLTDVNIGGGARLFVGTSGTVDVYGSDSNTIPASFATMSCPEGNQKVTGVCSFGDIPRYLAIKTNTGTPEIIITNCKCYEVKSIS